MPHSVYYTNAAFTPAQQIARNMLRVARNLLRGVNAP